MFTKREKILDLYEHGYIKPENINDSMELSGVFPDRDRWYLFIERFLLWLGLISIVAGIVFFVAYNWNDMGRVSKLGLLEVLLVLSLVPLMKIETHSIVGKILLFGSGIVLGALLALFGQIYQTGADTWQLFATWAVLLLPLAWIARFEPLWILWLTLVNISMIICFYTTSFWGLLLFSDTFYISIVLLLFNTIALASWEWIQRSHGARNIYVEFPALFGVISATWIAFVGMISHASSEAFGLMVWALWLAGYCWVYRQKIHDLIMLTMGCISALIIMVAFLVKHLSGGSLDGGGLMLIAISIVAAGSFSANWLKNVHHKWEESDE